MRRLTAPPDWVPARLKKRGYDSRDPKAGAFCSGCGAYSPMTHKMDCPKPGVRKSIIAGGVAW